jgi:ABC-type antimicrobial peptide transport system permease subunit
MILFLKKLRRICFAPQCSDVIVHVLNCSLWNYLGSGAHLVKRWSAVGLYSVVSYTVAQRTNEFGIRMALGAGRGHVLRIVFASTLASVGGGVLCGLALTLGLNKIVAQWADGNAHDPIVLLVGTLLLGLVAGIACAIPAQRAYRVDPMTALRCD